MSEHPDNGNGNGNGNDNDNHHRAVDHIRDSDEREQLTRWRHDMERRLEVLEAQVDAIRRQRWSRD